MKKQSLIAVAAILAGAGAIAYAQPSPQPNAPAPQSAPNVQPPGPQGMRHGGSWENRGHGRWANMSEADRAAFLDARIAAIKAGLTLNEAQQKQWPAVEAAMRELHKQRMERAERMRKEGVSTNPLDRMKQAGESMAARGAAMTKLADAAKPLYDSLNDDQKRRLQVLVRGGFGGMGMRGEQRQHGMHHRRHWDNQDRRRDHRTPDRGPGGERWRQ